MKFKNSVRFLGFWRLISALRSPASAFCKIIGSVLNSMVARLALRGASGRSATRPTKSGYYQIICAFGPGIPHCFTVGQMARAVNMKL